MTGPPPLIRSSLLAEFPALVQELGGPLDEILEIAGLSLEQIEQPTLLIPFASQIRLLQVAAERCSCEAFALELARCQDTAIFGALSVMTKNADTVRRSLRMFGRYLHYSVQSVELEFREEGELSFAIVDSSYELACESHQFWDHSTALLCSVVRMICGQEWTPRSVYLRRPEPPESSQYSRYFRAPVAFHSEFSGLVSDRAFLDRPVSSEMDVVPAQLQQYLKNTFADDFPEQVRRVINSLLSTHDCTAGNVARCMGLSKRTLQRKLEMEHTSFQKQLDRVRAELAISYLQERQFNLTDIGELLGFAELPVFTRSFRRWFGVTPSQWRTGVFH